MEKAKRRQKDLIRNGENQSLEKLIDEIRLRDKLDSERENAPLMKAKDAIVMIDDINFIEVENASKEFVSKHSKNYEILKEIKTANNHCHPSYWNGLMFIRKNY